MRLMRVRTALWLTLTGLVRRRIVLLLVFIVPTLFTGLVLLTTTDSPIQFLLPSIGDGLFVEVPQRDEGLVFVGLVAVGVLTAVLALYLVQHGKALPETVDPDRHLSEEGVADVKRVAAEAKSAGVSVSIIRHSGKARAAQTAELMQEALRPPEGIQVMEGLKPNDNVAQIADEIDPAENIMLVGHLPFMERFASLQITGDPEKPVVKFHPGGIVCLDRDEEGNWFIQWSLSLGID